MNTNEIESLEKRYLNEITFFVDKNIHWFLERLNSKNETKQDWLQIFKKYAERHTKNHCLAGAINVADKISKLASCPVLIIR